MQAQARHALIIEDDMIIALEVEYLLKELGYQSCAFAMSPGEALDAARDQRPDLITADYRILEGTGVEAVAAVHAAVGLVPVVYVTGNRDVVKALSTAPIVQKPVAPMLFADACREACAA